MISGGRSSSRARASDPYCRGQLWAAANTRQAITIRTAISQTRRVIRSWRIAQAMSNRSVCTRSGGTPSSRRAASAASIIGSGPQMKN